MATFTCSIDNCLMIFSSIIIIFQIQAHIAFALLAVLIFHAKNLLYRIMTDHRIGSLATPMLAPDNTLQMSIIITEFPTIQ